MAQVTEFLIALLPAALFIWCVHILFQPGHLLEKLGGEITNMLGEKKSKPFINCPICMSSVWGALWFYALSYFFGLHLPLRLFVPYIFCLCGLQVIITKLISKERIIVDE